MRTNKERADSADMLVSTYCDAHGFNDLDEVCTDIIADLCHLMEQNDIDIGEVMRIAYTHFEEETDTPQDAEGE